MGYFFSRQFLHTVLLFLVLAAIGCQTENKALTAYKAYTFDTSVMARLPQYDSLASAILGKITVIHTYIHDDNAYYAFRYMPASKEAEVLKKLPPELAPAIDPYISKIGTPFIYGFDVFKDSTIKIYVRSRSLEKVDMVEILSYYPAGKIIHKREYPAKDTILNTHWQYWARFDNQGLF